MNGFSALLGRSFKFLLWAYYQVRSIYELISYYSNVIGKKRLEGEKKWLEQHLTQSRQPINCESLRLFPFFPFLLSDHEFRPLNVRTT